MLSEPGFARAAARKSCNEPNLDWLLTNSRYAKSLMPDIGTKSASGSNPGFLNIAAVTAVAFERSASV